MTPFSARPIRRLLAAVWWVAVPVLALTGPSARAVTPAVIGANVLIDGRGNGHGRGMSQYGAYGYAVDYGWSWDQILGHYYGGTTLDSGGAGNPEIRVRLLALDGQPFTTIVRSGGGIAVNGNVVPYLSVVVWQVSPGNFQAYGNPAVGCPPDGTPQSEFETNWQRIDGLAPGPVELSLPGVDVDHVAADQTLAVCMPTGHTVGDQPKGGVQFYRGRVRVLDDSGSPRTVAVSTVDSYLRSVVPSESPSSWGTAGGGKGEHALYAQAVAARSYALASHRYTYADICDTQACQVYRGSAYTFGITFVREQATTDAAVVGTSGTVLRMPGGTVAVAEFSSSSGGFTAGGTFPAVEDLGDATAINPYHRWATPAVIPRSQIEAVYPTIGSLLDIQVLQRNGLGEWGGRVQLIKVLGTAGTVTVSGNDFRAAFGLRSDWFNVSQSCVGRVPPPFASLPAAQPATFTPVSPTRIVDTRLGTGAQALAVGAGCTLPVIVLGRGGVPQAADVTAVTLNVTATRAVQAGFLTVYPCGVSQPDASNVNYAPGVDRANMVNARVGVGGQVCIYASAEVDVIVDVLGSYRSGAATPYEPVVPVRVDDTRFSATPDVGVEHRVELAGRVPPTATAVALNLTATRAASSGFVKLYPCGEGAPDVSNINYLAGRDVANQAVVKLGAGQGVCAITSARTDIVLDLLGWFGPDGTKRYVPTTPNRVLDTRLGTGAPLAPVQKGATLRLAISPNPAPAGASAAALNVTAADAAGASYVVVHPCTVPPPDASNLNFRSGEAVANLATVPLASDGAVCLTTSVTTNLIADLNGWYV